MDAESYGGSLKMEVL